MRVIFELLPWGVRLSVWEFVSKLSDTFQPFIVCRACGELNALPHQRWCFHCMRKRI